MIDRGGLTKGGKNTTAWEYFGCGEREISELKTTSWEGLVSYIVTGQSGGWVCGWGGDNHCLGKG